MGRANHDDTSKKAHRRFILAMILIVCMTLLLCLLFSALTLPKDGLTIEVVEIHETVHGLSVTLALHNNSFRPLQLRCSGRLFEVSGGHVLTQPCYRETISPWGRVKSTFLIPGGKNGDRLSQIKASYSLKNQLTQQESIYTSTLASIKLLTA